MTKLQFGVKYLKTRINSCVPGKIITSGPKSQRVAEIQNAIEEEEEARVVSWIKFNSQKKTCFLLLTLLFLCNRHRFQQNLSNTLRLSPLPTPFLPATESAPNEEPSRPSNPEFHFSSLLLLKPTLSHRDVNVFPPPNATWFYFLLFTLQQYF